MANKTNTYKQNHHHHLNQGVMSQMTSGQEIPTH